MWILIRLVLVVGAFLVRRIYRAHRPAPDGQLDGQPYFVRLQKRKKRIQGFGVGVPLETPWFRLTREGAVDRLFKALRVATEAETGDATFDRLCYIGGDDPALHRVLRKRPEARAAITRAFDREFFRITGDGAVLWLDRKADRGPEEAEIRSALEVRGALGALEAERRHPLRDPFLWTTLLVETVIWMIAAYALGAVLELVLGDRDTRHLDRLRLVGYGLAAGALMFAALFGTILVTLRRSARAHRLIVESAVVLLLSLPIAGIQVVADLNRSLDRSGLKPVARTVIDTERVRRKRRSTHYLILQPAGPGDPLTSDRISVSSSTFQRARPGSQATFHLGDGFLGIRWCDHISID